MSTGGKTPKGAPKLKRSGRHKAKYARQFTRTFHNKQRRVLKHNGQLFYVEWAKTAQRGHP